MKAEPDLDKYFYCTGLIGIGLAVIYFAIIKSLGLPIFPSPVPCGFHAMTGLYCPGCGGTRAVAAFLEGKLVTSAYYHALVPYIAVWGGWFMLSQTIERLSKGRLAIGLHYRNLYLWIALAIVVIHCLVKNIALCMGIMWME